MTNGVQLAEMKTVFDLRKDNLALEETRKARADAKAVRLSNEQSPTSPMYSV